MGKDRANTAHGFRIKRGKHSKENDFAIEAMSRPFEALGYNIIDKMAIRGYFEKGSVLRDDELIRKMHSAGTGLSE
jgi:hypothetical protein